MFEWFYILCLIISGVFALAFILVLVGAVQIYFNVEQTMMKNKEKNNHV